MNKLNDAWKLIACPPRQHYIEDTQVQLDDKSLHTTIESFAVQSYDGK